MYWPALDELDEDTVDAAYAMIAQMVEEKHPELNARRGVLGELVTELHAILQGASMAAIEKLRRSISAMELAIDPEQASPAAVDALASNYRIYRRISQKAHGVITVVLDRAGGVNLSKNTTFRARGQLFYVQQQVSVKRPGAQQRGRHDVNSVAMDDGKFSVQVPVVAAAMCDDAMLKRDDELIPGIRPAGFVSAHATSDFVGGAEPQSNADLVQLMQSGAALPGFSGPENIKALVHLLSDDIADIVVLGANDPEMTRDCRDGAISGGGKIDIYLKGRSSELDIAAIQAGLDDPAVRQPGLDVQVKEAEPVKIVVDIHCQRAVDAAAYQLAAANYVNKLPIGVQPRSHQIANALPDPEAVDTVTISGETVVDRTQSALLATVKVHACPASANDIRAG